MLKALLIVGFAIIGVCAGTWIVIIAVVFIQITVTSQITLTWQVAIRLTLFILLFYFAGRYLYRKTNTLYCHLGQSKMIISQKEQL